jgi:hypothetical protein
VLVAGGAMGGMRGISTPPSHQPTAKAMTIASPSATFFQTVSSSMLTPCGTFREDPLCSGWSHNAPAVAWSLASNVIA